MSLNLVDYTLGIFSALLGRTRKDEGFSESMSPASIINSVRFLYSSLPILIILQATIATVYGLGAARLAYCYQMATSPNSGFLYIYVALAFFFSPIYYPYYGIVLNPQCNTRSR